MTLFSRVLLLLANSLFVGLMKAKPKLPCKSCSLVVISIKKNERWFLCEETVMVKQSGSDSQLGGGKVHPLVDYTGVGRGSSAQKAYLFQNES